MTTRALDGLDVDEQEQQLRKEWKDCVVGSAMKAGRKPPELKFINSEYRSLVAPLQRQECLHVVTPHLSDLLRT